jgi:hypothetical protein
MDVARRVAAAICTRGAEAKRGRGAAAGRAAELLQLQLPAFAAPP